MAIQLEISAQTPGMDAATADVDKLAKELADAQREADAFSKATDKSSKELKDFKRPAEQAAKATDKTARSMDKAGRSATKFGAALGSAKGAIAGAVLGLSTKALLELGEAGGQLQAITRNLESLGYTADNTSDLITRLGGGSVASVEKLISTSDAAGLSFEQMQTAADAALSIAIKRGEDSAEVYTKLSKALATGKVSYLKQIGINIDLKATQEAYAESIGKTAKELSATEKQAAISEAALSELNSAFGGGHPDKYASNIGAVRDAFNDLGDEIKRLAGNALSDLGGVLGWLRGGARGEIAFASDPVLKRSVQIKKQITEMEEAVDRLESSSRRGLSEVADTVLDLQERMGGPAFTAMLGLPSETEITRLTAGYIGAQERIQTQLATARKQLAAQIEKDEAEADIAAGIKAEQDYQEAQRKAREKAAEEAKKAAKKAREKAAKEAKEAEKDRLSALERLRAAYFDRRAAREFEQEEAARERLLGNIEKDARTAADIASFALQSMSGESGFDAIEARYQIQKDAALTAAQAEIRIAQEKGESIESIERGLQSNLLSIEQERLAASKAMTESYISTASSMAQDSIGAISAISNAVLGPEIASMESKLEQLRVDAQAAKGTGLEAEAEKKVLAAEREVAKARAKQARIDAALGAADQGAQALGQIALAAANFANPVAAAAHGIAAATHTAAVVAYSKMASIAGGSVPTAASGGSGGVLGAGRRRADPAAMRPGSGSGGGINITIQDSTFIGDDSPRLDATITRSVRRAQGVMGGTAGGRV